MILLAAGRARAARGRWDHRDRGGRGRRLPFLEGYENVHALRTLADARLLRQELVRERGWRSSAPASSAKRSPRRRAGSASR